MSMAPVMAMVMEMVLVMVMATALAMVIAMAMVMVMVVEMVQDVALVMAIALALVMAMALVLVLVMGNPMILKTSNYIDPVHIPTGSLVVFYEGQPKIMLNKALLDQQNCWENLEAIKEVHWLKLMFNELIRETNSLKELKELVKDITECEFELQRLWGFPEDIKFHKFWLTSGCTCPKLDNEDIYPSTNYWISGNCLLHRGTV